jgi:hypothetical protein
MNDVVIKAGDRPIRAVHEEIQAAANAGASIRVTDTRARHNLGVGLPQGCRIRFEGPVGYYCGGLNSGARIEIAMSPLTVMRACRSDRQCWAARSMSAGIAARDAGSP